MTMRNSRPMYIHPTVVDTIIGESQDKYPLETGGIVVGSYVDRRVVIVHAIGPGPRAIHAPTRFVRDGAYAQQLLDTYVNDTGGTADYIGEWHSHPVFGGPSACDKASMHWISSQAAYHCREPILIICQKHQRDGWVLCGYQWYTARLRSSPIIRGDDE